MNEECLRDLRKAARLLEEAAKLIEQNIDGHVLAYNAHDAVDKIRELSSSNAKPYSVRNLIRTVETDEGLPGWSRPLASVKYVNRKDL